MPKISNCNCDRRVPCHRCSLYAHNPYLVCAVHPDGIDGDRLTGGFLLVLTLTLTGVVSSRR